VDERVVLRLGMLGGVLRGRLVAAADVAAVHASAQVEPPAVIGGEALDAAGPAGRVLSVRVSASRTTWDSISPPPSTPEGHSTSAEGLGADGGPSRRL
jgi:hypothetical protein